MKTTRLPERFIAVHPTIFNYGLRLPLPRFLAHLCTYLKVPIGQLSANCLHVLTCLHVIWCMSGCVYPTPREILQLYRPRLGVRRGHHSVIELLVHTMNSKYKPPVFPLLAKLPTSQTVRRDGVFLATKGWKYTTRNGKQPFRSYGEWADLGEGACPDAEILIEFLENQGFLANVSSENEIQVWDLEHKQIAASLQWKCRITALSIIYGTNYMYIGNEYAMVSLVKFDAEDRKIKLLPYYITSNFVAEAAGMSLPDTLSVVGVLHQPSSPGNRLRIAYENGLIVLWDAFEDQVVIVRGSKDLPEAISDSKQVEKQISSLCWVCDNGSTLAVGYIDGDIMFWDLSTSDSAKDKSKNVANNVSKLQLSTDENRLPVIVLRWSANRGDNYLFMEVKELDPKKFSRLSAWIGLQI